MGTVAPTARVDVAFRTLLTGLEITYHQSEGIHPSVSIGEFAVVGRGTTLGEGCIIDTFCIIEPNVHLGARVLVCYRAQICMESVVADEAIIGGFIGERSRVEAGARVFGSLVHKCANDGIGWDSDAAEAPGPTIEAGAFVGFGAIIIGDVRVGAGAYVGANAVVTRNVPAGALVVGRDEMRERPPRGNHR